MYLIGLTGGIGCGKSTVAAILAELGVMVIDADWVYRDLIAGSGELREAIADAFGEAVLAPEGTIDRRALGTIVFADPAALARLESITHPVVERHVLSRLGDVAPPLAVVEAIKLLEAGWDKRCDAVWVVTCTPAQQVERLRGSRGLSLADIAARVQNQMSPAQMIDRADVVIDNSGDLEATRRQVVAALTKVDAL